MFSTRDAENEAIGMLDASWQMQQTSLFEDDYLDQVQQEEAEYNASAIQADYAEEKATQQFQAGQRQKAGQVKAMMDSQKNTLLSPDIRSPKADINEFNAFQAALEDEAAGGKYAQQDLVEGVGSPYMSQAFKGYSEALYRQKLAKGKSTLFAAEDGLTAGDEVSKLMKQNDEIVVKAREHALQSVMDVTGVNRDRAQEVLKRSFPEEERTFAEELQGMLTPDDGLSVGGVAKAVGVTFLDTLEALGSVGTVPLAWAMGAGSSQQKVWDNMVASGDYDGMVQTMMEGKKEGSSVWKKVKGAAARAGLSAAQLINMAAEGIADAGEEAKRALYTHGPAAGLHENAKEIAKGVTDDPAAQKAIAAVLPFMDPTLLALGGIGYAAKYAKIAPLVTPSLVPKYDSVLDALSLKTAAWPQKPLDYITYKTIDSYPASDLDLIMERTLDQAMRRIDDAANQPIDIGRPPKPPDLGDIEPPMGLPGERGVIPPAGPPLGDLKPPKGAKPINRTQAQQISTTSARVSEVWPDDRGMPLGPEPPALGEATNPLRKMAPGSRLQTPITVGDDTEGIVDGALDSAVRRSAGSELGEPFGLDPDIEGIHRQITDDIKQQTTLLAAQNGGKVPEAEARELASLQVKADVTAGIVTNEASAKVAGDVAEAILADPQATAQSRNYAQKLLASMRAFVADSTTWHDADAQARWTGASKRHSSASNPKRTPVALPDFIDVADDGTMLYRTTPQSQANRLHKTGGATGADSRVPELKSYNGVVRTHDEVKDLVNKIYEMEGGAEASRAQWAGVVKNGEPQVQFQGISDKDFDSLADLFGVPSPVKGMDDLRVVEFMKAPGGMNAMNAFRKQVYDKLPPAVKKIYGTEEYGKFLHKTATVHNFLKEELVRTRGSLSENAVKAFAIEFKAVATGNSDQLRNMSLVVQDINNRRGVRFTGIPDGPNSSFTRNDPTPPGVKPTEEGTARIGEAKDTWEDTTEMGKRDTVGQKNTKSVAEEELIKEEKDLQKAKGWVPKHRRDKGGMPQDGADWDPDDLTGTYKKEFPDDYAEMDGRMNDDANRFDNMIADLLSGDPETFQKALEHQNPEALIAAMDTAINEAKAAGGADWGKLQEMRAIRDGYIDDIADIHARNSIDDIADPEIRAAAIELRDLESAVGQSIFRHDAVIHYIENGELNLFNLRDGSHLQEIVNSAIKAAKNLDGVKALHTKAQGVTDRISHSIFMEGSTPHKSIMMYKSMGVQQALKEAMNNGGVITEGTKAFLAHFDIVAASEFNAAHTWVKSGMDQISADVFQTLLTPTALKQGKFDLGTATAYNLLRSVPDKDRMVADIVDAFSNAKVVKGKMDMNKVRKALVKIVPACQTGA